MSKPVITKPKIVKRGGNYFVFYNEVVRLAPGLTKSNIALYDSQLCWAGFDLDTALQRTRLLYYEFQVDTDIWTRV